MLWWRITNMCKTYVISIAAKELQNGDVENMSRDHSAQVFCRGLKVDFSLYHLHFCSTLHNVALYFSHFDLPLTWLVTINPVACINLLTYLWTGVLRKANKWREEYHTGAAINSHIFFARFVICFVPSKLKIAAYVSVLMGSPEPNKSHSTSLWLHCLFWQDKNRK